MSTNKPALSRDELAMRVLEERVIEPNYRIKYPRFGKKLEPSDIGLREEDCDEHFFNLGRKNLLATQAEKLKTFKNIENTVSKWIVENSFELFGARLVPIDKIDALQALLDEQRTKFFTESVLFLNDYNHLRELATAEWLNWAEMAISPMTGEPIVNDVEAFMMRIEDSFPAGPTLQDKFNFEFVLKQCRAPQHLSTEITTFQEQKDKKEAMQQALHSYRETAKGFIDECMTALRVEAMELFSSVLTDLKEGGTNLDGKTKTICGQKSLDRVNRFIEHFEQMNISEDEELAATLQGFRNEFLSTSAKEYRDNESALQALHSAMDGMTTKLRTMVGPDYKGKADAALGSGGRKLKLD